MSPFHALSVLLCSLTVAACGSSGSGNDAGPGSTPVDAGPGNTPIDAGPGNTPVDAGPADAGPVVVNPGNGTGPAATLACTSSGQNAFTTYGSAGFVAVNKSIFANVNSEITANGTTNLGSAFTLIGNGNPPASSDNLATFEGKLAAFLVYVYGGPSSITYTDGNTYQGPQNMVSAHSGFHITSDQYGYFVANIVVPALTSNGVKSEDVSSCFAPPITSAGFEAQIVGDGAGSGAGASLSCASSNKNAFSTYGAAGFVAVNESIFTNVSNEITANGTTNLGTAFTKIGSGTPPSTTDGAATFKGKLAAFLVYTYGGPSVITYTDNVAYYGVQDMAAAHAGLGITDAQYGYFVANIVVPALTSNGVTSADVSSCFAPTLTAADFEATIVGQ
jgi:hypothetical protein